MADPSRPRSPSRRRFFWAVAAGLAPVVSLPLVLLAVYRQWSRGRRPARDGEVLELVTPELRRYRKGLVALAVADVLVAACWTLELLSPTIPGADGPPPRIGVELVADRPAVAGGKVPPPKKKRQLAPLPKGALPRHGAVIGRVLAGSPAARAGLQAGDQILRIDGVPTPDDQAVAEELAREGAGTPRIVEYRRKGQYRGTSVIPEAAPDDGDGEDPGEGDGPGPGASPGASAGPPSGPGPASGPGAGPGSQAQGKGKGKGKEPGLFEPDGPAGPAWPGRRTLSVVGIELLLCGALWWWIRRRGVTAGRAVAGMAAASLAGLAGHVLTAMLLARIVGGSSAGGALLGLFAQVAASLLAAFLAGGGRLLRETVATLPPSQVAPGEAPVGTPPPPLGLPAVVALGLLLLVGGAARLAMLTATVERLTGLKLSEVQVTDAFGSATRGHAGAITFLALTVALVGPLAEELVFRGLALPVLLRLRGATAAVLLSALGFTLAHAATYGLGMVQVLWAGVALGWIALASRGLLAPVLVHALYNGVLVALYFLTSS